MHDRRCFVQFIHPGGEHWPDDGDLKRWNRDQHRRKFLASTGRLIDVDGREREKQIEYWGEWEAQSRVLKCYSGSVADGPSFLWEPFLAYHPLMGWRQNTDPFVFGEQFLYTGCMQHTSKGPTQLRHLVPGSVVLFGSCRQKSRFVIDTVFVVGERSITHSLNDYEKLRDEVSEGYWRATIEPWYSGSKPPPQSYRLYFGATPQDPVGGMFSFFPCRPLDADGDGFARPEIRMPGLITSHLTQGKKMLRDASLERMRELWQEVVEQVQAQDLFLGVHAELPPERSPEGLKELLVESGSCDGILAAGHYGAGDALGRDGRQIKATPLDAVGKHSKPRVEGC